MRNDSAFLASFSSSNFFLKFITFDLYDRASEQLERHRLESPPIQYTPYRPVQPGPARSGPVRSVDIFLLTYCTWPLPRFTWPFFDLMSRVFFLINQPLEGSGRMNERTSEEAQRSIQLKPTKYNMTWYYSIQSRPSPNESPISSFHSTENH